MAKVVIREIERENDVNVLRNWLLYVEAYEAIFDREVNNHFRKAIEDRILVLGGK